MRLQSSIYCLRHGPRILFVYYPTFPTKKKEEKIDQDANFQATAYALLNILGKAPIQFLH